MAIKQSEYMKVVSEKCPALSFPNMEPCTLEKGHKGLHFSMHSQPKEPWQPRKKRTAKELEEAMNKLQEKALAESQTK